MYNPVYVLQWKRHPSHFQLSLKGSFGQCLIRGFATKRNVSLRHARCEPCTTSPECIGFTNGKGTLLILQLSPKGSFGQRFIRVFATKQNVSLRHADSGAKGIGFSMGFVLFHSPGVHARASRSLNAARRHERIDFSKGFALCVFCSFPHDRLRCGLYWFS